MLEDLRLPPGVDGLVVRHRTGDVLVRRHRHAELEVNLVVRGTATYLLRDRRYELTPGTLTWLFPGQEHLLVGQSPDHEVWWAVFRPELVARHVTAPHPLLEDDPPGTFSRRINASRLQALFGEIQENRINAGLGYLLMLAWHTFRGSDDVVGGTDIHPAVRTVAHILRTDPNAGDLSVIARRAGLSPTYLSRIFKAQTGISLSRYRNQQRLQRFLLAYGDGERTTALAAALEAGFGSYAQFHRVYRQEMGVTDGPGRRRGRG